MAELTWNTISFSPSLDGDALSRGVHLLMEPGVLGDLRLERYVTVLESRFRNYLARCPVPQWAPGLVMTSEIRIQHEMYLPMAEIAPAFGYLCRIGCRCPVNPGDTLLTRALSWPDLLSRLQFLPPSFNPAALLRKLAVDERLRQEFLFALCIPRSYGGGFGRYPGQMAFLSGWLSRERARLAHGVAVMDAACGCGESTYEIAECLEGEGFRREVTRIDGSTLEPMELLAAAFGHYPNDPGRSALYRRRVAPLLARGWGGRIRFSREDLCTPADHEERHDVILCNGLLGGPLLQGGERLSRAVGSLVARLEPGGVLLVADHFHGGWKKKEQGAVSSLLRDHLLEIVEAGEGLAGIKSG